MDFKKLLDTEEYRFLHDHPRLGEHIMLLGLGGSYAYGTNREGSDIDLRGVTLNLPSDILGLTTFNQYEDAHTDTVIYSFNKLVRLFLNCNPNTIELLGLDEDQYLIRSELGQPLPGMETVQDEYAIATMLLDMGDYLHGGPEPYPLQDALDDAYFWLLSQQALATPWKAVTSQTMPWSQGPQV